MKSLIILSFLSFASISIAQSANSWVKKNDFMGYKREQAVSFSIGNKGYVATGVDTSETVCKDLWEYDPQLDSWTQRADFPGVGRRSASAFSAMNKGYVGLGIDSDEATMGNILNDFWEYTPSSNMWAPIANFPGGNGVGVYYATAFSADNKGYVCGGKNGPSSYMNDLWEYKPSLDQWTQRADFPGGIRYNLSSLTINDIAYVGLGTDQDVFHCDWWRYHPGTNQWTAMTDFIGGNRGGASTFTSFGKGYVCLGTNGGLKGDLFVFDPIMNVWYPRADYGGSERKQAISFTINNHSFVGLGSGTTSKKGSMYEYIPGDFLELESMKMVSAIYPNPATEDITIQMNASGRKTIRLRTVLGQICYESTTEQGSMTIPGNDFIAGTYYCEIQDMDSNSSEVYTIQFAGE